MSECSQNDKARSRCGVYSECCEKQAVVYSVLLWKPFGLSHPIKGEGRLAHVIFRNQCWLMHLICSDRAAVTVFLVLPEALMDISSLSLLIEEGETHDHMIFMKLNLYWQLKHWTAQHVANLDMHVPPEAFKIFHQWALIKHYQYNSDHTDEYYDFFCHSMKEKQWIINISPYV